MMEQQLLLGCLLSLLLGALGQGFRSVAGLKKMSDQASADGKTFDDLFSRTTLLVSLFIGAMAGVAAYLGMQFGSDLGADFAKGTTSLGIIAAGYSGADFIEAFGKKYLPK